MNLKFLLSLLAVVAVLGGLWLDYYLNGEATWVSYVLFFGALGYVLWVVFNSFRTPKGPAAIVLLVIAAAATSCATRPVAHEEVAFPQTDTYTAADGFDQTVAVN